MKKKNGLMNTKVSDFKKVVQSRLVERYADDAIKLIEETKKLEEAHKKFNGWVERVEKGDFTAIEEFKKQRTKLEEIDDYEME